MVTETSLRIPDLNPLSSVNLPYTVGLIFFYTIYCIIEYAILNTRRHYFLIGI
jgi:hypothetical protein